MGSSRTAPSRDRCPRAGTQPTIIIVSRSSEALHGPIATSKRYGCLVRIRYPDSRKYLPPLFRCCPICRDKSAFLDPAEPAVLAGFAPQKEDSRQELSDSRYEQDFLDKNGSVP